MATQAEGNSVRLILLSPRAILILPSAEIDRLAGADVVLVGGGGEWVGFSFFIFCVPRACGVVVHVFWSLLEVNWLVSWVAQSYSGQQKG